MLKFNISKEILQDICDQLNIKCNSKDEKEIIVLLIKVWGEWRAQRRKAEEEREKNLKNLFTETEKVDDKNDQIPTNDQILREIKKNTSKNINSIGKVE